MWSCLKSAIPPSDRAWSICRDKVQTLLVKAKTSHLDNFFLRLFNMSWRAESARGTVELVDVAEREKSVVYRLL